MRGRAAPSRGTAARGCSHLQRPCDFIARPPGESQLALEESASWQQSPAFYVQAQK